MGENVTSLVYTTRVKSELSYDYKLKPTRSQYIQLNYSNYK